MNFFVNFKIFEKIEKFEKSKNFRKKTFFFSSDQKIFCPKTIPYPRVVHMQKKFWNRPSRLGGNMVQTNRQTSEFII